MRMLSKFDLKWLRENLATKDDLTKTIGPISKDIQILKKDMRTVKKTTAQIRKDLEMAVGELDRDRDKLEKRVFSVENQLGLRSSIS